MSKQDHLNNFSVLFDKFSVAQIIGLSGVIFYLHILGIREALGPIDFVFNNPIDAGYVLTDIALAFAFAYLFDVAFSTIFVYAREVFSNMNAKWKGLKAPIIISSQSDLEYAYDTWKNRAILTIVFYAWHVWLIGFVVIALIFAFRFLARKFPKEKPISEENPYRSLSSEEHAMAGKYLTRTLHASFIAVICVISYAIGLLRVDHLTLREPTIMVVSQGTEYQAQVLYSLSDSYVIQDIEAERFILLPKSGTIIQEP